MDVPPEILELILKNLPQYYLVGCLQVCRTWYQVAQPLLYKTVEFYSDQQIVNFIKTYQEQPHTSLTRGVNTIDIYCSSINLENTILGLLQRLCPNVKVLASRMRSWEPRYSQPWLTEKWKSLTTLSVDPNTESSDTWCTVATQLVRLDIMPMVLYNAPERRLADALPPQLPSLVELYINFSSLNLLHLDDSLAGYLAASCPCLSKLTLSGIKYPKNLNVLSKGSITPVNSVTTLCIFVSYRSKETSFFDHYGKTFPNLTSLDLNLTPGWDGGETDEDNKTHQMAVFKLIDSFRALSCLHVRLTTSELNHLLPTATMMEDWLLSSHLSSFAWPDYSVFKSNANIERRTYLEHLTCLTMKTGPEWTHADLLRFLTFDNTRPTIPDQLSSLKITGVSCSVDPPFKLSVWAKASPWLKELTIENLTIANEDGSNNNKGRFIRLTKLKMLCVAVYLDNGLTNLARHFPVLNHFYYEHPRWIDISPSYSYYGGNNHTWKTGWKNLLSMDASHWDLDYFYLSRMTLCNNNLYMVDRVKVMEVHGEAERIMPEFFSDIGQPFGSVNMSLCLKSVNHLVFE